MEINNSYRKRERERERERERKIRPKEFNRQAD